MAIFSILGYFVVFLFGCSSLPRDKRNACALQSSCENGGSCRWNETARLFTCDCDSYYTGMNCETRLNTGENENSPNITCETDVCVTSNPCYNGGTCVLDNSTCTATCQCSDNYTGYNCTQELPDIISTNCDFCNKKGCMNGGICLQNGSSCQGSCDCSKWFTGPLCQYPDRGCQPGFYGARCHAPCPLDCGENGICDINSSTTLPYCWCKGPYTGTNCLDVIEITSIAAHNATIGPQTFPGHSDEWKFWILGCSLVLLFVLVGFCILIYTLLKRRNIFIMKLKYYLQPFEDDDGKEFDAFISYKSAPEDETFVYRTLYTELEVKRGYRLCLHHRDFTVGDTIANNILNAIANSRRTILVLSPRYMESDFTRFEYQEAHAAMLNMEHKVIPLLLEDVAQQKHLMDRTLASILKSITYIEWPGVGSEEDLDKFWTRLELSLPKKRAGSSSPSSSYPVLSFSESSFDSNGASDRNNIPNSPIEKQFSKGDLSTFFNDPVDEEKFRQMRERASEYSDCWRTYL